MSGNVTKHVTVLGELSRQVNEHKLLEISECQQELVCSHSVSTNLLQRIQHLVLDPKVSEKDAIILAMIFGLTLRGIVTSELKGIFTMLKRRHISEKHMKFLNNMLEYGNNKSKLELYENNLSQDVSNIRRRLFKGLKGVDNVYTQHQPLLVEIISSLLKGRLKDSEFPYCFTPSEMARPSEIIIFIVGGATHEEAAAVQQLNIVNPGIRILLGGTTIHNSNSFIESVNDQMDGIPKRSRIV